MGPGRACVACHAASNAATGEGDAPLFAFAGTMYPTAHEPDHCIATAGEGAVVEVVDARGVTFTATANGAGNSFSEDVGLTPPYRAQITFAGRTRQMLAAQTSGDCNGCHTQRGDSAAPGRILLP
jgi:cytochrome c553